MTETIFSKILRGEIPCHKVYEDSLVLAFLDASPLSRGHTLVIPKEPAPTLAELSEASSAAIGRALPSICRALQQAAGTRQFNVLQNNGPLAHQAVRHVHFHIIPKPNASEGLGVHWPKRPLDHEDARKLAEQVQSFLQSEERGDYPIPDERSKNA